MVVGTGSSAVFILSSIVYFSLIATSYTCQFFLQDFITVHGGTYWSILLRHCLMCFVIQYSQYLWIILVPLVVYNHLPERGEGGYSGCGRHNMGYSTPFKQQSENVVIHAVNEQNQIVHDTAYSCMMITCSYAASWIVLKYYSKFIIVYIILCSADQYQNYY